jgi:hypothetical protein
MRRTESWLKGLGKKETEIFISKKLNHIEIFVTTTLFGRWVVKEDHREVFLPDLKTLEQGKLRVICEAYLELHEIAEKLKEEYE